MERQFPSVNGAEMNVVYVFFNRPDKVRQSFDCIRAARPSRLFLVADGPRPHVPTDAERCAAARHLVDEIDWPCEVFRDYSECHLGCGRRVASGITGAFAHVDRVIILEDDCVPARSFFPFCRELLDRYEEDSRIMAVCGDNFQNGIWRGEGTYYFSKHFHCWGWATWKRAWNHFDLKMTSWPAFREAGLLRGACPDESELDYWSDKFDHCHRGEIDSWAYPFTLACWMQNALSILPNVNLVSNIGFGADATHTVNPENPRAAIPVSDIASLVHPRWVCRDVVADQYTTDSQFLFRIPETTARRGPRFYLRRLSDAIRRTVTGLAMRHALTAKK
jgi:hypothetical protein